MTDKRHVKHNIQQLQAVKTWQLVVLLILALLVAATFLRLNNIGMVERRNAVLAADKSGNTEDITNRLYDLQRYVSSHMNASTGKIALQHQYERDAQKAKSAIDSGSGTAAQQAAIAACDPVAKANGWRWPDPRYIACVDKELTSYNASSSGAQVEVKLPDQNLYYHEFTAPLWSPDFAGWSVLVCLVIIVMIGARLLALLVLRAILRRHYSPI